MKLTCGLTLTLPLLLVLLMVVATKGHTVLQCYVCDNCEKVNKKLTPLEQCGGENFHMMSTTTAASASMSSSSRSESTTTSPSETSSTTTAMPHRDSTARPSSTEDPETTNTTIELITLSTSILTSSTTPSTVDSSNASASSGTTTPAVFVTPTEESSTTTTTTTTTTTAESDLVIPSENITWAYPLSPGNLTEGTYNRQRRHTEFNGITYYCYKIQKRYDNVFGTKRGCIGVKTNERPVCDELDMANNNQTKKCSACTTTMCNGSSALGVSIAALLVALVALIYKV
ncbi:uncharacterized protein LOC129950182 [Eupeodes corollae]|uniref:uncharacterized protein LOC129950182 n=1 Tax=Eupeodes corollae TaxID=290404 RepID=UPI00249033A3|nr:uncharacterized protein LOC129950182 [Eupeodes corollae]